MSNPAAYKPTVFQAGEKAPEMCRKISSRAEEIAAQYKGEADMLQNAGAWLNPKNWASGSNTTNDVMRNIINTDLSNNDIMKIQNDCSNSTVGVQINEIDLTACKFCETNRCDIKDVTQENINRSDQQCTIQSAIETLMTKKNSVDAQALAKSLQKAQDVLSGNNVANKDNCNVVLSNLSSNEYMEQLSNCANRASVQQTNRVKACGAVSNLIQRNVSANVQSCVLNSTTSLTTTVEGNTVVTASATTDQTTTGISVWVSLGSSLSCALVASVVVAVGYMAYTGKVGSDSPEAQKAKLFVGIALSVICFILIVALIIWAVVSFNKPAENKDQKT